MSRRSFGTYTGHFAVRGVTPSDPRVLYACGDALAYSGGRSHDTTQRGARALSHTFDPAVEVTCEGCRAASWRRGEVPK